jgi:hypothetical protein
MDQKRATPPEYAGGRNFLEAVKAAKYRMDRAEAMRVGDYIDMSPTEFNSWIGDVLEGDPERLKGSNVIRVTVTEIISPINKSSESTRIAIEANGVKKQVDASLFYSYGYRPDDDGRVVTNMPTDYDGPPHDKIGGWG